MRHRNRCFSEKIVPNNARRRWIFRRNNLHHSEYKLNYRSTKTRASTRQSFHAGSYIVTTYYIICILFANSRIIEIVALFRQMFALQEIRRYKFETVVCILIQLVVRGGYESFDWQVWGKNPYLMLKRYCTVYSAK